MIQPAIEITRVYKSFLSGRVKKHALTDISLTIQQGDVYGFLGPNGAGKSTTIKLLLNFLKPDSGDLCIYGNRVGKEEFRHRIGYLSEFPFFYEHLTARETLMLSGRLSGVPANTLKIRIPALLNGMSLGDVAGSKIRSFSKGMKQRLGMANALVHDPEVLVFDEPMSGLDPVGRHQIKKLITQLKKDGKTVFFSSHIISDIEELCDEIGIINKGNLLYSGGLAGFLATGSSLEESFIKAVEEADNANRM